jgi:basic amino acid/polyamine antiporter, APA family
VRYPEFAATHRVIRLPCAHIPVTILLVQKTETPPQRADDQLVRAIGVSGLAANIINTTIGAGIFVLPALVAKGLGPAAPLAFLICAVAMILFVTCFAIAGSRVSLTGGLYAYVEVAFGRYVGFLGGILYFLTAILAVAGVVNVFADTITAFVPILANPIGHLAIVIAVYTLLVAINIMGVRAGSIAVNAVTLAKLVPLLIFVLAGFFFIKPANIGWSGWPGSKALGDSVLLLIFAFVGVEVALVPSGEVKTPSRTVPRAIYIALIATTLLYISIQLVAQGTLGQSLSANTVSPLAESAARFLGNFGRVLLLAGATISAFGFVTSDILSSPRIIFALGRDRMLPAWFAHVHPRFRSPDVAIVTYAFFAFICSLTSSFERLAVMSNVAVLLLYILCCAAAWILMQRDIRSDGAPFSLPGAKIFPLVAIIVIVWILVHATRTEFEVVGEVLAVASILYFVRSKLSPR